MRDISRLGAWLGDTVNTELCVRARTHRSWLHYVVVLNSSYKVLGRMLGLDSGVTSSAKNLGNIFEHLMWLALEEDRCEWILGVLECLPAGDLTLYFSDFAGETYGPYVVAADEQVDQIQRRLEDGTFKSRCVDEETNKCVAHVQISTSRGIVLEGHLTLFEYAVHDGDTLTVIMVPGDAEVRESA